MRRKVLLLLGGAALALGCSSRVIGQAHDSARLDGGDASSADSGVRPSTPDSGATDSSPDGATTPYAACPSVFSGPVTDAGRHDHGTEGLAVLRARVLKSRSAFEKYAAAHGNTYRYTRQTSTFLGDTCASTIRVTNGVVTSNTERTEGPDSNGTSVKTGAALLDACHPSVTMDALYEECLTEVLCQDSRQNELFVEIDSRGLLLQCGYWPVGCMDDCYVGIERLILTADGTDLTTPPGCCPPSPAPGCCMSYGGPMTGGTCPMMCDGMPPPDDLGWSMGVGSNGCASWFEPPEGSFQGCCGCALVDAGRGTSGRDAGTSQRGVDPGTTRPDAGRGRDGG